MKISVVIPAYNEEEYIGKCLQSLVNQDTHRKFEVIVVDNNSTDQTSKVTQKYRTKLDLEIMKESRQGRGAARACGFAKARGEVVFGTEADTVVPADWIETIIKYFEDQSDIAAVSGTCKFDSKVSKVRMMDFFQPRFMRIFRLVFGYYWLSGFNFAIRKDIYNKSGGFDRDLTTVDDVELALRVNKIGRIKYLPNIPVIVSGRRFEDGIINSLIEYIKSYWDIFILHKKNTSFKDVR